MVSLCYSNYTMLATMSLFHLLMNFVDISLCSAAEYLFQIVHGAIPQVCFEPNSSVPPVEIAVHILDYLYTKLDQVCLVQGGEVGTTFYHPTNQFYFIFFVISRGFFWFTPFLFKCKISVNSRWKSISCYSICLWGV
jgi:gamma-tubulin complex component 5